MKTLKVAFLTRGSDKKQTNKGKLKKQAKSGKASARILTPEDDLPLQRNEIVNFIESQPESKKGIEWVLSGHEYVEAGVSAYHTHTSKRVGLQDAFEAAKKGEYDILVLFKLDRFGRRSTESLMMAEKFLRYCRIWVVDKAMEFTNKSDSDQLLNFIEFWHAKKASEDTKIRVTAAMKQIAKEGVWTGGNPPYGFENDPDLSSHLIQVPEEVKTVKTIFDLYVNHGYGFTKIAAYLNDKGIKSKTGRKWSSETVRKVSKNTIYKGYLSYGKTQVTEGEFGSYQKAIGDGIVSDIYHADYDIVGAEIWDKAQEIKKQRIKPNMFGGKAPTKKATGKGLLVGILKCECGGHMTYSTTSDWTDSTRTTKKEPYGVYRCITRLKQGVKACGAKKATYRVLDIEKEVIDKVFKETKIMIDTGAIDKIRENTIKATADIKNQIKEIKDEMTGYEEAKNSMQEKLLLIMRGKDAGLNENLVNAVYEEAEEKLKELKAQLEQLEALKSTDDMDEIDNIKLEEFILNWRHIFEHGTQQQKRNLLQSLLYEVKATKEKTFITIGLELPKFIEAVAAIREPAAALDTAALNDAATSLYYGNGGGTDGYDNTGIYSDDKAYDKAVKALTKKLSKVFIGAIEKEVQIEHTI